MDQLRTALHGFARDERGATVVEYGLLAGILSVALLASLPVIGTWVDGILRTVGTAIASASD
jgi:pilus assembly protein Flp/PilA